MFSPKVNDSKYVAEQYRTTGNLQARISLHERYSTNAYGWQRWVFDQFSFPQPAKMLELGCGPANLWRDNLDRLPEAAEILLTDSSEGMLAKARQNMADCPIFHYQVVDAQNTPLPFQDGRFDRVIANHMLYHLSARQAALSEICRILAPGGILYASTVGERHLCEITELIHRFDPSLSAWGNVADSFKLENGAAQLTPWFSQVSLVRYEDSLAVTEAEPLVEYILSGWLDLPAERRQEFSKMVEAELCSQGGIFRITKASGMFISRV